MALWHQLGLEARDWPVQVMAYQEHQVAIRYEERSVQNAQVGEKYKKFTSREAIAKSTCTEEEQCLGYWILPAGKISLLFPGQLEYKSNAAARTRVMKKKVVYYDYEEATITDADSNENYLEFTKDEIEAQDICNDIIDCLGYWKKKRGGKLTLLTPGIGTWTGSKGGNIQSVKRRMDDRRLNAAWAWIATYSVFAMRNEFTPVEAGIHEIAANSSNFSQALLQEFSQLGVDRLDDSFKLVSFSEPQAELMDYNWLVDWENSTSTSTTSITSTTTTTIMHNLYVVETKAYPSNMSIVVYFNMPCKYTASKWAKRPVSSVFWPDSLALLGSETTFQWNDDMSAIEVLLDRTAPVTVGDILWIKQSRLVPSGNLVYHPTPTLNTTITAGEEVILNAKLTPSSVFPQACSQLQLGTADTIGLGGRLGRIVWGLGPRTTRPISEILEQILEETNDDGFNTLTVPPANLSRAVYAVRMLNGEDEYQLMTIQIEVVATITSWLGSTETVSVVVTIDKTEEPLPQVSAITPTALEVENRQTAKFGVEMWSVDQSQCVGVVDDSSGKSIESLWQYRACPTKSFNDCSDDWDALENVGLKDRARAPGVVDIAGFSFRPDSHHQFQAVAFYPESTKRVNTTFSLTVLPRPKPVVSLTGPEETSATCKFTISSDAKDTSIPETEAPDFLYRWSCYDARTLEACDLPNFDLPTVSVYTGSGNLSDLPNTTQLSSANFTNITVGMYNATNGTGALGKTLDVPGGYLPESRYVFSLLVWRRNESEAEAAEVNISLNVSMGAPPPITMITPWTPGGSVPIQTGGYVPSFGFVKSFVRGDEECPVPMTWFWDYVLLKDEEPEPLVLSRLGSYQKWVSDDELLLRTGDFQPEHMVPGELYSYALMMASSAEAMDNVTAAMREGAEFYPLLHRFGAKGLQSAPFVADGSPKDGSVFLQPLVGEALTTLFAISTSNWLDEEETTLEYAFYQFPLPDAVTLYENEEGELATRGNFELPFIEWHDHNSKAYYVKQGGLELRGFSSSKSLRDVRFGIGSFFLLARARDVHGAEGLSRVFLGPLVTEPAVAISTEEVEFMLDGVLASGDANGILNTVDSLLSVSAGGNSSDDAAFAQATLNALISATAVIEPTASSMRKMAGVLSDVLDSSAAVVDAEMLAKASDVLSSCLDAMLEAGSTDVGQDTYEGFLGNLATISIGTDDDHVSSGSLSKEDTFLQTAGVISKLGSAVLNNLAPGATNSVTSIGEDGKGLKLQLAKEDLGSVTSGGLVANGVAAPGSLFAAAAIANARRLQAGVDACSSVEVSESEWVKNNPYSFADVSLGYNQHVQANSNVKFLDFLQCGSSVSFSDASQNISVAVTLPKRGEPPWEFRLHPYCAMWDDLQKQWNIDGLEIENALSLSFGKNDNPGTAFCLTPNAGGSFTSFWLPVRLPPTTTTHTTTRTTFTSTSTTTTWECPQNMDYLQLHAGAWNCSYPKGVAQTCEALCLYGDQKEGKKAAIYCSKHLTWIVIAKCPQPTALPPDPYMPQKTDNTQGFMMSFLAILLVAGIACGICGGTCCYVHHFTPDFKIGLKGLKRVEPDPVSPSQTLRVPRLSLAQPPPRPPLLPPPKTPATPGGTALASPMLPNIPEPLIALQDVENLQAWAEEVQSPSLTRELPKTEEPERISTPEKPKVEAIADVPVVVDAPPAVTDAPPAVADAPAPIKDAWSPKAAAKPKAKQKAVRDASPKAARATPKSKAKAAAAKTRPKPAPMIALEDVSGLQAWGGQDLRAAGNASGSATGKLPEMPQMPMLLPGQPGPSQPAQSSNSTKRTSRSRSSKG